MAKSNSTDDDSGVGIDYASSNDQYSSTSTLIDIEHMKKRNDIAPLIKFTSNGIVERIRPITMKNSENGDFVLCQTNRGAYVAYRTPIVPEWVTRLVQQIEYEQR
jgi:hypothetical protein